MRAQRRLELTATEVRERIYRHVWATAGWVPIADLIPVLRDLGCSCSAGDRYLRDLCVTGRLEREHAPGMRSYRYRIAR